MRMAAAADRAIGAAADGVGRARATCRSSISRRRALPARRPLNGRYGRGRRRCGPGTAPAGDDEEIRVGRLQRARQRQYELLPEEKARRINREIFYRKLQPDLARVRPRVLCPPLARSTPPSRPGSPRPAAPPAISWLATGVEALAGPSNAQQTKLFTHQLAAAHRLMMRLSGRADAVVTAAAEPARPPEGLRLAHGAARLMERFRQGVAMLSARTGPDAPRRVENYLSARSATTSARKSARTTSPRPRPRHRFTAGARKGTVPFRLRRRSRAQDGADGKDGKGDCPPFPRGASTTWQPRRRLPGRARARRPHARPAAAAASLPWPTAAAASTVAKARARALPPAGNAPANNRLVHGLRSAELTALSAAAAAAHRQLGALLAASAGRACRKVHRRSHRRDERSTLPRRAGVRHQSPGLRTRAFAG